ncbi:MAG TPA: SUKH-3 domain-containing protein [Acidimicrobiales bacterium]|nr:SUKH-3 domain-containing protein [Acidimicrobiales bacterium]
MTRFTPAVSEALEAAGWSPGRRLPDEQIRAWSDGLPGFAMFPAAEAALREFGGLAVDQHGPGIDRAREPFELDPLLAWGEEDRFELFADEYGVTLFPLGEAAGSHYFLAVDPGGRTFLVMDDIQLIAESFDDALESLILGKGRLPFP